MDGRTKDTKKETRVRALADAILFPRGVPVVTSLLAEYTKFSLCVEKGIKNAGYYAGVPEIRKVILRALLQQDWPVLFGNSSKPNTMAVPRKDISDMYFALLFAGYFSSDCYYK